MQTVSVLFKHTGCNSDTAYEPVCIFNEMIHGHLLERKRECCLNYDNDMMVSIHEYRVLDCRTWSDVEDPMIFARLRWYIKEAEAAGLNPDTIRPEVLQKLMSLADWQRWGCYKLLKTKNFRSEFRAKMREQLDSWLRGESNYESPFSPKQWMCLGIGQETHTIQRVQDNLYRSNRYVEYTGFEVDLKTKT